MNGVLIFLLVKIGVADARLKILLKIKEVDESGHFKHVLDVVV